MVAKASFSRRVSPGILFLVALLLGLAAYAPPARAAIINVTPAGAVDNTVNGNCSLVEAIQSANGDMAVDACTAGLGFDIIVVPAGTYTLTAAFGMGADGNDIGLPQITTAMRLDGAGAAATIIERDPMAPAFRIFDVSGSADVVLNNVTVRNGLSPSGAGVRVAASTALFAPFGCVFDNNSATAGNGGAIEFVGFADLPGLPEIDFVIFFNNTATGEGGAIFTSEPVNVLAIEGSSFFDNSAGGGGGAIAGGAFAGGNAGAVSCARCAFTGNSSGGGGAIFSRDALILTDSFFSGNTTGGSGGALFVTSLNGGAGRFAISGVTFAGNSAFRRGAIEALDIEASSMVNSTLSGNMATNDVGGLGIINVGAVTLNNLTITNNSAGNGIGGVEVDTTNAAVSMANTIIAGNTAGVFTPDCQIFPMNFSSQGFNLIGIGDGCNFPAAASDQVGSGGAPIDPLLGALADNGGPTAGAVATPIPTHFPQPGSPALDAGNNLAAPGSGFPACEADDQLDVARPLGPRCDIGAVESIASADISIVKTDNPDPVAEGDNIIYTFTVTNNGPNSAFDVTLADSFDASLTYTGGLFTNTHGICILQLGPPAILDCNHGTLLSGESAVVQLELTTSNASVPMVSNTVNVTTTSDDPDLANNSDTEVTVVSPLADITVSKADNPDPVLAGQPLTYTVTVVNNGPSAATGVSIIDTLPANVTFNTATPSQGMCAEAGGIVTCNLGDLAVTAAATVDITVTPGAAAVPMITNTVDASANEMDPDLANNTATQDTTVQPSADLAVTKTDAPDPARVANPLTYTVTVTNNGPSDATGVMVTDTLPGGVTFNSATPSQGTCSQAAGVVTCPLGNLALSASATVTITVTPTAAGMLSNTASVAGNEADPTAANDMDTEATEAVDFTIAAMPASVTVTRGNSGVYTITYTPVGSSFPFAISGSCSGLPAFSSCLFQNDPATPNAAPVNSTLVIQTTAPIFSQNHSPGSSPLFAFGLGLPLFFFGAVLLQSPSRRRHWRAALALAILLVVMLLNFGCATGELPDNAAGTPVGTFPITITGTSGNLTHSTTVNLVVQ